MIELSVGDVLSILLGMLAFMVSVYALAKSDKGKGLDNGVMLRIDQMQANRDYMDKLERAYESANVAQRLAFDRFSSLVKTVAPYTPMVSDDAIARFLEDVKAKGDPKAVQEMPKSGSLPPE